MISDAPSATRRDVNELIRTDKRNYALLLGFALRVNGRRSRSAIVDETSFAHRRPIDGDVAQRLFDALTRSG